MTDTYEDSSAYDVDTQPDFDSSFSFNQSVTEGEKMESNEASSVLEKSQSEETPKKRGRGRPRKHKVAPPPEEIENKPKRGRGRPRKYPLKTKEEEALANANKPKRGRGRPRKRPLEAAQTPSESEEDRNPKRGRGRPRKIPKLSQSQEIITTENDSPKRGRGRPRKYPPTTTYTPKIPGRGRGRPPKNGNILRTRSHDTLDIIPKKHATRASQRFYPTVQRSIDEEGYTSSESDVAYLSDTAEDHFLFEIQKNGHRMEPYLTRGEQLHREVRVQDEKTSKNLTREKTIEIESLLESDELFSRYAKALQLHFSPFPIELIYVNEDDRLLCPCCSRSQCHLYCPMKKTMDEVHSTLSWMEQLAWNPRKFSFSTKLSEEEKEEFTKRMDEIPDPNQDWTGISPSILEIVEQKLVLLEYVSRKLRVREVDTIQFQRAVYRFSRLLLDEITLSDLRLLVKLIRLLLCLSDRVTPVEEAWKMARAETAIEQREENLEKLLSFTNQLLEYMKEKQTSSSSPSSPMDSLSKEAAEDEWGVHVKYIEYGNAEPVSDNKKMALFAVIPSRHSPETIIKMILRGLEKDFNFKTKQVETSSSQGNFSLSTCIANDEEHSIQLVFRADNWAACDIHLFIRITAPVPHSVEQIIRTELKKHFRGQEDMNAYVAILPYHEIEASCTTANNEILKLSITTGEENDDYFPSTLIIGSLGNEAVCRCLLTWCYNLETSTNGPTIQYISVKKSYRGQKIASTLLQWIENEFLKDIWRPQAKEITLYATFVCSAHSFFEKNGFVFYDFYNEEAKKQVKRKKGLDSSGQEDVSMDECDPVKSD